MIVSDQLIGSSAGTGAVPQVAEALELPGIASAATGQDDFDSALGSAFLTTEKFELGSATLPAPRNDLVAGAIGPEVPSGKGLPGSGNTAPFADESAQYGNAIPSGPAPASAEPTETLPSRIVDTGSTPSTLKNPEGKAVLPEWITPKPLPADVSTGSNERKADPITPIPQLPKLSKVIRQPRSSTIVEPVRRPLVSEPPAPDTNTQKLNPRSDVAPSLPDLPERPSTPAKAVVSESTDLRAKPSLSTLPQPTPTTLNESTASSLPAVVSTGGESTGGNAPRTGFAALEAASGSSEQLETLIDNLSKAREGGKLARGEMQLRHEEFGLVTLKVAAADSDLKASIVSRDPAFVIAAQNALAERIVLAPTEQQGAQSRNADQAGSQGSHQSGHSSGNAHDADPRGSNDRSARGQQISASNGNESEPQNSASDDRDHAHQNRASDLFV